MNQLCYKGTKDLPELPLVKLRVRRENVTFNFMSNSYEFTFVSVGLNNFKHSYIKCPFYTQYWNIKTQTLRLSSVTIVNIFKYEFQCCNPHQWTTMILFDSQFKQMHFFHDAHFSRCFARPHITLKIQANNPRKMCPKFLKAMIKAQTSVTYSSP